MNFADFIKKYEGQFVEYHSYGTGAQFQCVDLVNQYIVEVLQLPAIIGTNAQDFPSKISNTDYDWIVNTPTGVPQNGDIVIFKSADNVGHISIFIEGTANLFTSFDQNYPTGSPSIKVNHNYRNVIGWLHPKEKTNALTECLAQHTELVNKCNEKDTKITELNATIDTLTNDKKELDKELVKTKTEVAQLQPMATEWNVLTKMYPITSATDMDTIVKALKEEISVTGNITQLNQVLDKYKQQVLELKKLSVKTVSKTTLIKELINRFTKK